MLLALGDEIARKPRQLFGIDFSGMVNAGKKIWIARGSVEDGSLLVEDCRPGETLPGSGPERDRCLAALRSVVAGHPDGLFGFDFPFGIPRSLVPDPSWDAFITRFPERYRSADEFRACCRAATPGMELKRTTDRHTRVPFAAYNVRLYRQTFYGIHDVLHPLVRDGVVCVLPMQEAAPDRAWLIEICPASTLKREGLYLPYKGKTAQHREARRRILAGLEGGAMAILTAGLRSTVLDDAEGDALDSVVAAFAAFRMYRALLLSDEVLEESEYGVEGYVYS